MEQFVGELAATCVAATQLAAQKYPGPARTSTHHRQPGKLWEQAPTLYLPPDHFLGRSPLGAAYKPWPRPLKSELDADTEGKGKAWRWVGCEIPTQ